MSQDFEIIVPELIFPQMDASWEGPWYLTLTDSHLLPLMAKSMISLIDNAFLKDGLWPELSLNHDPITYYLGEVNQATLHFELSVSLS